MLKNFVLLTASGEGLPIALDAQRRGLSVVVGILSDWKNALTPQELDSLKGTAEKREERDLRLKLYDGILDKFPIEKVVAQLKKIPEKDRAEYFIFCDMNYVWRFGEDLKDLGFPGIFPTLEDRLLEADRAAGKDMVRKFYPGLKLAEVVEFDKVEEAMKFLEGTPDLWVLKSNDPNGETVVPQKNDPEMAAKIVMDALDEGRQFYEKAGFILERKIEKPLEITPMICFYNGEVVFTDIDIELKHYGSGDSGGMVGCSANLVFPTLLDARINKIAFPPKVYEMAKTRKGLFVIDASILFDPKDDGAYFGEFCPRFGYDALFTEIELAGGTDKFFNAIVSGRSPFETATGKYGAAVRFFNDDKETDGEIWIDEQIVDHVWLFDGYLKDKKLRSVAYGYDLAVITAAGDDPYTAFERVFKYFDAGFDFKNVYYRPAHDILSYSYFGSISNRLDFLNFKGWLLPLPEYDDARDVAIAATPPMEVQNGRTGS